VAEQFHLKIYVDMVMTDSFHTDVIAYPAITVISREEPGPTRIAHRPQINAAILSKLALNTSMKWFCSGTPVGLSTPVEY
jgi:hypothetical protein